MPATCLWSAGCQTSQSQSTTWRRSNTLRHPQQNCRVSILWWSRLLSTPGTKSSSVYSQTLRYTFSPCDQLSPSTKTLKMTRHPRNPHPPKWTKFIDMKSPNSMPQTSLRSTILKLSLQASSGTCGTAFTFAQTRCSCYRLAVMTPPFSSKPLMSLGSR